MKNIYRIGLGIVALMLASCTTYQYTARQTDIQRQNFITTPTVVDVKADYTKRVEVVSDWHPRKEDAINECKYIAIISKKIDVVVDPIFKIQYRPWKMRKKYQATLTGYSGYYENSRTVYEDMELLQKFSREDIEKYLLFHDPTILQYMNAKSDVINIYHENGHKVKPTKPEKEETVPTSKQETKSQTKRK